MPGPIKALHSQRTLPALKSASAEDPSAVQEILTQVADSLRAAGHLLKADDLDRLAKNPSLLEESETARMLFPLTPDAKALQNLATQRAETVGWSESPQDVPLQYLHGKIDVNPAGLVRLTTAGGKEYTLASSSKTQVNANRMWISGFMGDGNVTVQGTLGYNGTTFNIEGFALNNDGKFDRFTAGRIVNEAGVVTIQTARGAVEITDPEFKKCMGNLPGLYTILPGEPDLEDGQWRYKLNPDEYYNLAKFMGPATKEDGQLVIETDMALSVFRRKPVFIRVDPPVDAAPSKNPEDQLRFSQRLQTNYRVMVRGKHTVDSEGLPMGMKATYVSKAVDPGEFLGVPAMDADLFQAAVLLPEAGDARHGSVFGLKPKDA